MKIPYGLSHYKTVIKEGYTYIDKTAYIKTLEETGRHNMLLRPRRFGKSLFLSMLWYYYDSNYKDDFESLFGNFEIAKQLTESHSSYQVLFLEFSGIETDQKEPVYISFAQKIESCCKDFFRRYHYPESVIEEISNIKSPADKIQHLLSNAHKKIYLLIDEYDHFSNTLMADDLSYFRSITNKGGFVRSFYEVLKTATQTGVLDRLFITGITPIMLDSMTSGFNMVENLSLHNHFNQAIGFTRKETKSLLAPLADQCELELSSLMADITRWYNGYSFSEITSSQVYNADMVLYFVKNFDLDRCTYPRWMLDENIASDYGKILAMFAIGNQDENYKVLEELVNEGEVTAQMRRKFDFDKGFDRSDFISLLYYMGFISFKGFELTHEIFCIPNYVIKVLYFEYFKVEIERLNEMKISIRTVEKAIVAMALKNNMQPLRDEMQRVLSILSNRDFMRMDEKHIKTLLITLLYQSSAYFVKSEPEVNHYYPDIMLLERSPIKVNHQHLIELKYCKKKERKKSAQAWQNKLDEGIEQVKGYLKLEDIQSLENLSAWVILTDGEEVLVQAVVL